MATPAATHRVQKQTGARTATEAGNNGIVQDGSKQHETAAMRVSVMELQLSRGPVLYPCSWNRIRLQQILLAACSPMARCLARIPTGAVCKLEDMGPGRQTMGLGMVGQFTWAGDL